MFIHSMFVFFNLILSVGIALMLKDVMSTQKEAADTLIAVKAQLNKVRTEIQALKTAAQNSGDVGPELQAAIDGVVAASQEDDEENPDA